VLVTLGLLGLPGSLLVASVREPMRRHRAVVGAAPKLALRNALTRFAALRSFLVPLYVAMGLSNICDYSLLSWTPALLSRRFGLGAGEIVLCWALSWSSPEYSAREEQESWVIVWRGGRAAARGCGSRM
jgi:hypothetical protein